MFVFSISYPYNLFSLHDHLFAISFTLFVQFICSIFLVFDSSFFLPLSLSVYFIYFWLQNLIL